jgi:signal transduction histidine kinase
VQFLDVLQDLEELYGPMAEERGFTLEIAARHLVTMPANRQLLSQGIGNLLENALKYAPGGPVRLILEQRGGMVAIGVEDKGPGIPAADRERALKRFGRLDPARTEVGAGLGLALVQSVARLHAGSLVLEDAAPGLRALLILPLAGTH